MTSTRSEPLHVPILTCVHVALHRAKGYFPWSLVSSTNDFGEGEIPEVPWKATGLFGSRIASHVEFGQDKL